MIKLSGLTVWFDVDDTLVLWDKEKVSYTYSKKHAKALKEHALRGHTVIVWSAGGADWAERVVREMGLEWCVDLVTSKPSWFYDDKTASYFMPEHNRVYHEKTD